MYRGVKPASLHCGKVTIERAASCAGHISGFGSCVDSTTLHVLLVVFFATLVRSTFGFGEALIAVPLLALTIPIGVAAPLAVLLSITIAAVVVVQDWRKIHVRSTGWLLAPTFVGIPLGVWLLTSSHQRMSRQHSPSSSSPSPATRC